jgi:hypothetical protein
LNRDLQKQAIRHVLLGKKKKRTKTRLFNLNSRAHNKMPTISAIFNNADELLGSTVTIVDADARHAVALPDEIGFVSPRQSTPPAANPSPMAASALSASDTSSMIDGDVDEELARTTDAVLDGLCVDGDFQGLCVCVLALDCDQVCFS